MRYSVQNVLFAGALIASEVFSMRQDPASGGPVVGIDLGSTYARVGRYRNGVVEIIPNDQGNRITPAYVAFVNDEKLVGDAAKNQAAVNPQQTLFDVKRLIGRRYNDESFQVDKKFLPYTIVEKDGKPYMQVNADGEKSTVSAEEVWAMLLARLASDASKYLGTKVKRAIVTVPAYFNEAQRQATTDAGRIAGIEVLSILSEPEAVAGAYDFFRDREWEDKNVVVFDLGGSTLDVSIMRTGKRIFFKIVSTGGDMHLGGNDFDMRVMDHFIEMFKKTKGKDIRSDKRAIEKLRNEVEFAKKKLSKQTSVIIKIPNLIDGVDFIEELTRVQFESLNDDLFQRTLEPLTKALKDSNLSKKDIDEIVLVGGSSYIPKIQELLKNFFDGKDLNQSVNPDEAVAYGAAIAAGKLRAV